MIFRKINIFILSFFVGILFWGILGKTVYVSESREEQSAKLKAEIEQYEKEIDRLKNQASTLSNQIAQYDAQIKLTKLKITQTEEKISLLGGRIGQLESSLTVLTNAFNSRVVQTYKMSKLGEPFFLMITAKDLSDAVYSFHYIKKVQEADHDLLERLINAQENYRTEKTDQERLQGELTDQKSSLDAQKVAKSTLLSQTKNNEKRYQQLLAQAKSEFEAIQAIIAGKGEEQEIGKISQGARIASIIQGASCNSDGSHLHFIVKSGDSTQNPFSYLKSVDFENCSG